MSVFFAILSILLYGVCHLLARSTKPDGNFSFRQDIILDYGQDEIVEAIRRWASKGQGAGFNKTSK